MSDKKSIVSLKLSKEDIARIRKFSKPLKLSLPDAIKFLTAIGLANMSNR